MDYVYTATLLLSFVISMSTSRIVVEGIRRSPHKRLYLSLLLGVEPDEEEGYKLTVNTLCLCVITCNLVLFMVDPLIQLCLTLLMLEVVISRVLRVRKQLSSINKLIEMTSKRCDVHPEIIQAICMEENGEIFLVCPKCNPELAADFGITEEDCLETETGTDTEDLE